MKTSILTSSLLFGITTAQSLTSILGTAKDIDDIKDVLTKYPSIVNTLTATKGITIFLPRDGAKGLSLLSRSSESERAPRGLVENTLTYHVAKGVFPAAALPASAFVETLLTSPQFSGVTGGQRVQVTKKDGKVQVIGGGAPVNVVAAVSLPPFLSRRTAADAYSRTLSSTAASFT
jgi:fasciclin domain-containing protein